MTSVTATLVVCLALASCGTPGGAARPSKDRAAPEFSMSVASASGSAGGSRLSPARRCEHEREPSPTHPVKHPQGTLDQRGVVRYAFTKSNGGGVRRNRLAQLVRPMTPTERTP